MNVFGNKQFERMWENYEEGNDLTYFFVISFASFLAHELLHLISSIAFPVILSQRWRRELPDHKKSQIVHAPNQVMNGLIAGILVKPSLTRFPSGGEFTYFNARSNYTNNTKKKILFSVFTKSFKKTSVMATAASCGYLFYDLLLLAHFDRKNMLRAHGRTQYMIYIWHHVLPLLMWPIALKYGTFEYFVSWGVRSELSQAAMGLRTLFIGMGLLDTILGMVVQIGFIGVYFYVIMWPLFDHVTSMIHADWFSKDVPRWQLPFAFFTIPVPAMLNVYWWFLIMSMVWKVLKGEKQGLPKNLSPALKAKRVTRSSKKMR